MYCFKPSQDSAPPGLIPTCPCSDTGLYRLHIFLSSWALLSSKVLNQVPLTLSSVTMTTQGLQFYRSKFKSQLIGCAIWGK